MRELRGQQYHNELPADWDNSIFVEYSLTVVALMTPRHLLYRNVYPFTMGGLVCVVEGLYYSTVGAHSITHARAGIPPML
jgi:hypothetical protein